MTQLGWIPSEADLARVYGYRPVHQGWIRGEPVLGLALAQDAAPSQPYVDEFMRIQRRNSWLQVVSTVAVVSIAAAAIFGCFRR